MSGVSVRGLRATAGAVALAALALLGANGCTGGGDGDGDDTAQPTGGPSKLP